MSERNNKVIQFKKKKKGMFAGVLATIIAVALIVLFTCFHINDIEVTGNRYYSKEQIKKFVLKNGYVDNTVLLMIKNKIAPIKDIPFVAKLDVEYVNAHKITITVYEKALAGCVEYMNSYVYFDQDGYVLEISGRKLEDAPCITGMFFSTMELHEKLPIEDKDRFKLILKLTQLIQKYELKIDSIRFTSEGEIVLQYEDIRIEIGDGSILESQLVDLEQILQGLAGKKGTLDMRDFEVMNGKASFKLEKEESSESKADDVSSEERPENQ
ncbi:MAG: FtsQ-type POTRA domain-containing protein [Lachnospiraceae bacterium]|nr:FtsQ-type POTRA domain-containing protein [Lachnospiraceae bacterium]